MATPIGDLTERVSQHLAAHDGSYPIRAGLPVRHLRTGSRAELERDAILARDVCLRLDDLDLASLTADERHTAGFLRNLVSAWIDADEHYLARPAVTPYAHFFQKHALRQAVRSFTFSSADSADDVDGYLSVIGDYRDSVRELRIRLLDQAAHGIRLPQPAIPCVRESLTQAADAVSGSVIVSDEILARLPADSRSRLHSAMTSAASELPAAYREVLAVLDSDYAAAAPQDVGQAQYPGGQESYRSLVRLYTTSALTPEQIHAIGLDHVAELTERMAEVRAGLGAAPDEAAFHRGLGTDPRRYVTTPEQVERLYLRHMAALEPHLGDYFAILPRAPFGVARLSPELEAGMTYGYYQAPTPADPTGRYMYNGSALDKRSMLSAASLIFHELAPGHHFHLARQNENPALPTLRRDPLGLTGFSEGWAEYAAGLCWDMGLYEDPYDQYGRLIQERYTAARLVVDTGMNALGWTLRQGRDYMRATTVESEVQIASETLRYSTDIPGQALAYRLGMVEFTRLRQQARERLGARFDIRDFHEVILRPGALPFPVVAGNVAAWIDDVAAGE